MGGGEKLEFKSKAWKEPWSVGKHGELMRMLPAVLRTLSRSSSKSLIKELAKDAWRYARQFVYLQAANIAARALRNVLKEDVKVQALKREEQYVKAARWANGKQLETKVLDAAGNKQTHH
ncbi:hypothetical protein HK104_011078 [Borealophlyctis nickersoniae]|nr:hypothetical protein HK104_011078 [Borealophlyctis nickersoniae]